MSIHKRDGGYQVKWREGGRQRSRTFELKGHAQAFERDLKQKRQLGPALAGEVMSSKKTLTEFMVEEYWPRYAVPNLKPSTLKRSREIWSSYLLEPLGGYEMRLITPRMIEDLRFDLENKRRLGAASIGKALMLLSAIMRRAAARGLIPANPVTLVDKPKVPPLKRPQPLAPQTIETIRQIMLEPRTRTVPGSEVGKRPRRAYEAPTGSPLDRQRNATLVSLLAYGGLRPGEATTARWGELGERTLHVQASKTGRARVVRLLSPLVQDLAEWRMACGRPGDRELIFPCEQIAQSRLRASIEWQLHDWQNWVQRIYQPAAIAAGVTGDMRAYRLRGSFVSLALWEGQSLTRVADQAGHSVATLARHYAGVIEELEDQPKVPAGEAIRQAREEATGQLRLVAR